jgi:hypothetical protein
MRFESSRGRLVRARRKSAVAAFTLTITMVLIVSVAASTAHAGGLTCRKVVASEATKEGRNALDGSRARCRSDEMLTGGTCYAEVRPEADGSCQTSAMGIIQTLAESPDTTQGAFFTCLQTGGNECAVEERTRAMAICCKIATD